MEKGWEGLDAKTNRGVKFQELTNILVTENNREQMIKLYWYVQKVLGPSEEVK